MAKFNIYFWWNSPQTIDRNDFFNLKGKSVKKKKKKSPVEYSVVNNWLFYL